MENIENRDQKNGRVVTKNGWNNTKILKMFITCLYCMLFFSLTLSSFKMFPQQPKQAHQFTY